MEIKKMYELPCLDNRKSFYGKALVIELENGNIALRSYETIVCELDKNRQLMKYYDDYSQTTMRHINSFCKLFELPTFTKSQWLSLPCTE